MKKIRFEQLPWFIQAAFYMAVINYTLGFGVMLGSMNSGLEWWEYLIGIVVMAPFWPVVLLLVVLI